MLYSTTEYTLFWSVHGIFTKTDHIMGVNQVSFNKHKTLKSYIYICEHNELFIVTNKFEKPPIFGN